MRKVGSNGSLCFRFGFVFVIWSFEIVSDFEIRISDLWNVFPLMEGLKIMKKFNGVTMTLVILGILFSLMVGCGGDSPETVFGTAQFEEKQTNFTHARKLYQRIIREHPDSEWAKKAKEQLDALPK